MNSTAPVSRSRVLVAVGPAAGDARALTAAARLVQTSGARFTALFVEDSDLLRLAEHPFAFEISSTSPTPRPLLAADVERAFRTQADQLRRAFSELATALRFDFSFEVARGRPARTLLAASSTQDLVVLSGNAVQSFTHVSAQDVVREALRPSSARAHDRRRTVIAALQDSGTAPRVLAAAHALATAAHAELTLLLAKEQEHSNFSKMIRTWLETRHANAPITLLPDLSPESTAMLVAENDPLALFWPGDGESGIGPAIEVLLATLACPLVIVR